MNRASGHLRRLDELACIHRLRLEQAEGQASQLRRTLQRTSTQIEAAADECAGIATAWRRSLAAGTGVDPLAQSGWRSLAEDAETRRRNAEDAWRQASEALDAFAFELARRRHLADQARTVAARAQRQQQRKRELKSDEAVLDRYNAGAYE